MVIAPPIDKRHHVQELMKIDRTIQIMIENYNYLLYWIV